MIHLNGPQRWTLIIAVTIIALMLLFPPFQVETKAAGVIYSGYGFLFSPPIHKYRPATINVATLAMQWIGVLIIAGLLMVFFAGKKAPDTKAAVTLTQPSETVSDPQIYVLANPVQRFFARIFDVLWEGLPVSIILIAIMPWLMRNDLFGAALLLTILGLPIMLFIAIFIDALVFSVAGNTPGKALLGLRVVTGDGKPLNFYQYLSRNLSLPRVYLSAMASQYRRLSNGQQSSYDTELGFKVQAKSIGLHRKIISGLAFAILFLLPNMILVSMIGSIQEKTITGTLNHSRTSEIYHPTTKPHGADDKRIPTWDEISSSDLFRSMTAREREQVRIDYFNDLMVPLIPKSQLDQARELFDKDTIPSALGLTSLEDFKRANPEFAQVPDGNLFDFIHQKYYPNTDKNDLARKFGYK